MILPEIVKHIPKVELHDHLAGGMRMETIMEIADSKGIQLPGKDRGELFEWFRKRGNGGSLPSYLESFGITSAVLQDGTSLERVAYEAMLDFAQEHVVYAEIRFSPVHHTAGGLSQSEVVESVLSGLRKGSEETGNYFGLILCGMRDGIPRSSLEIAKLAVDYREKGVVGFDIAGNEYGYPPQQHLEAVEYAHLHGLGTTLHAGEADGKESIHQAVMICKSDRIGHGTRLIEDLGVEDGEIVTMGELSHFIRTKGIALEMCLTSNIGTGVVSSYADHPFPLFYHRGFHTVLCSDNRLMSNTSLTREMEIAISEYGLTLSDMKTITLYAMKAAFAQEDLKRKITKECVEPGYDPYL